MKKNGNGLLLDRILDPISSSLNEEAAQKILALKADRKVQARVTKLADKCNEGELTAEERREYEMYLMVNHFIAVLKARRMSINHYRDYPIGKGRKSGAGSQELGVRSQEAAGSP